MLSAAHTLEMLTVSLTSTFDSQAQISRMRKKGAVIISRSLHACYSTMFTGLQQADMMNMHLVDVQGT